MLLCNDQTLVVSVMALFTHPSLESVIEQMFLVISLSLIAMTTTTAQNIIYIMTSLW